MTKEEFVRERADLVIAELTGHYGVQRDKDGTRFIYSPMEELDDFISSFDNDIDSGLEMYDEDEFDDEDSPFPERCSCFCSERFAGATETAFLATCFFLGKLPLFLLCEALRTSECDFETYKKMPVSCNSHRHSFNPMKYQFFLCFLVCELDCVYLLQSSQISNLKKQKFFRQYAVWLHPAAKICF